MDQMRRAKVQYTTVDMHEVIDRVMNVVIPTNWNHPNYQKAKEVWLQEMAHRAREWEVDALVDAWVWFRIGFVNGHHAGWMEALPI